MMMKTARKESGPIEPLQEKVYLGIKERIVDCRMPPGAVISEELLSEEFGTSRTPIREALLRLQREDLVTIFPRRGTFVSQISLADIHEVYEVRLIIEPRVARISCHHLDAAELERYRDLFTRMEAEPRNYDAWFRIDRQFHDYIIGSSGNRHLIQLYGSILDQNQRMRILAGRLPMRAADTNREHAELVEALLARQEDRIETTMAAHITASRDAALRVR
jgi:GntR family transcriptional regulator, rspAB operon transcriptional repressor